VEITGCLAQRLNQGVYTLTLRDLFFQVTPQELFFFTLGEVMFGFFVF
jgi:hypothetical protein